MRKSILILLLLTAGVHGVAQTFLSRRQAMDDIAYYTRTMRESHYDPFRYISREQYDARVRKLTAAIGDSIHMKDFVWLCYEVTALLNDAHSTPQLGQPAFGSEFKKDQFFPYQLVLHGHRVYAPRPLADALHIPAATQLTDINGVNLSTFTKQVQQGIPGLPAFREAAAARLFSYFLFLKGLQPPFRLGYRDGSGARKEAVVATGVPFRKALSASLPHIVQPYESRILQGKLGYLDVRTLSANPDAFKVFLDSSFAAFRAAGVRTLAIDLRQNSGGNTDLGDLLFSYFTHKPYAWGKKQWKISEPYKAHLRAQGDTAAAYLQHANGTVWESGADCTPAAHRFRQPALFTGKVYFITGPFTFSSAMAVADVVKEYHLGTIIGEPTGENVQDFGEAFPIVLPNSQVRIQSTSSLSSGANCKRVKNGPVEADVVVRRTLRDEALGRDAVLEWLLR